jgi:hypothetical protein
MTIFKFQYIASKPVTFEALQGIKWKWIEAPPAMAENMAGCPVSKHEHGVIATDRYVLQSMLEAAGLTPVKS